MMSSLLVYCAPSLKRLLGSRLAAAIPKMASSIDDQSSMAIRCKEAGHRCPGRSQGASGKQAAIEVEQIVLAEVLAISHRLEQVRHLGHEVLWLSASMIDQPGKQVVRQADILGKEAK